MFETHTGSAKCKQEAHAKHRGLMPLLLVGAGGLCVTKLHPEACSCIEC